MKKIEKKKVRLPRILSIILLTFIIFFACQQEAIAGVTGKIAGFVKDTETGELLPGANILLIDTDMGAAADVDGYYYVINVPPGNYLVEARMMGYEPVTMSNVVVNVDHTTRLDFELRPTTVEVPGITIVAKREIIPMDISASQINITSEQIEITPVVRIEELIGLQPGIILQENADNIGLAIRGGGVTETSFTLDGMSLVNKRLLNSYMGISRGSIKEIQILTGGFNAEYGNIRSGLINIITKEGGDTYIGSIEYGYQPAQKKHFGPSAFDQNSNLYQTFAYGPAEKLYGGWSAEESPIGRKFVGWDEISRLTMEDDDPDNDRTPEECLDLWKWRHRGYDYADKVDQTLDVSFGGPLFAGIKFFTSYWYEKTWLAFPLARDYYLNWTYQLKLTSPITKNMKLTLQTLYGKVEGVKGGWLQDGLIRSAEIAAGYDNLFNEGDCGAVSDGIRMMYSLKLLHALGPSTFYTVYFDYSKVNDYAGPMRVRDHTLIKQIGDNWYDETPAGYEKHPEYPVDQPGMFGMSIGTETRDSSWYQGATAKVDFTSQITKNHQLKTGLEINYTDIHEWRASVSPAFYIYDCPARIRYNKVPINGAFYIQDKMEFAGMIANVGLRFDYLDPRTKWVDFSDPFDEKLSPRYLNPDSGPPPDVTAKRQLRWSPRLGIAHPVSEYSKLYFNYGHFHQVNPPHWLYRAYTNNAKTEAVFGDPNVNFPKTVAYELGYEHNVKDLFLIHVAGYYKDVTDELLYQTVIDNDASVHYSAPKNDMYADYRGIDISLIKPTGRFFIGCVNLDYVVVSSGQIGRAFLYEDPRLKEEEARIATQVKPYAIPIFNMNIEFHTPPDWGIVWGNIKLNLTHIWEAGGKWTYNPGNEPGVINNIQSVDHMNTNLRAVKEFIFDRTHATFFVEIHNLFNRKELYMGHFWDEKEWRDYMESLNLQRVEVTEKGDDRYGDYKQDYIKLGWMDYRQFLNPRQIKIGFRIRF